jgi:CBS domain-containing protein
MLVNLPSKGILSSVVDVMQTDVYTLSPETPVSAALNIAYGKHINHLLVVENEILAGILCRDDLCRADRSAPVKNCMTTPVPCVGPDTTLIDAAGIMSEQQLSCLAVVIDALLVGIVTRTELADIGFMQEPDPDLCISDGCIACGSRQEVRPCPALQQALLCRDCAGAVASAGVAEIA